MAAADFRNALNDTDEIELTTTGRTSGRQSSRPVWFVTQGETVWLLPVTGSDSQWYKTCSRPQPFAPFESAGSQSEPGRA